MAMIHTIFNESSTHTSKAKLTDGVFDVYSRSCRIAPGNLSWGRHHPQRWRGGRRRTAGRLQSALLNQETRWRTPGLWLCFVVVIRIVIVGAGAIRTRFRPYSRRTWHIIGWMLLLCKWWWSTCSTGVVPATASWLRWSFYDGVVLFSWTGPRSTDR